MKLFHSYNKDRKKEHEFLRFIINKFPDIEYINENYRFEESQIDSTIEVEPIIKGLKFDKFLPNKRKQICIDTLTNLHLEKVSAFESINNISIDFTIKANGINYFFELHEDQHKNLSVSRATKIFDLQGNMILIPRYLVRLLKDIWRWNNLTNYQIVWADWFEKHSNKLMNILEPGRHEYGLKNSFLFKNMNHEN
ncbi:MAG TPA: hypothetical protein P5531_14185 [Bacteroidales bacterium]|nr:hypothetical protein [Bacteroidales bacterium]HSA44703.1 hypothetical protein [Bacteroidales bacterium]